MLSASDIDTYRICPLKYKFARVLIPQEPTIHQRFGIVLHQVLERFHSMGGGSLEQLMELFEVSWRRAGFGDSGRRAPVPRPRRGRPPPLLGGGSLERRRAGLVRAQLRLQARRSPAARQGRPRGPPPDGSYELIDYKTGKSKTEDELREDVQLSLYQMGARESWRLETSAQAYLYVLTGEKVPVEHSPEELERVKATVAEIADGIMKQEFEPKPSQEVCLRLPDHLPGGGEVERDEARSRVTSALPSGAGAGPRRHGDRLSRRGDEPRALVALKVIAPDLATDPEFRARFEREARTAAGLDHPNVVPGSPRARPIGSLISMRRPEAPTSRRCSRSAAGSSIRRRPRSRRRWRPLLDAAHARGLVHRDVKPGNVLLAPTAEGGHHAYLTDFGITKDSSDQTVGLTQTGQWVGTVDYISPEQVSGRPIDARSDVYSLGCVLYQALTGHAPYQGADVHKVYAHVRAAARAGRRGRGPGARLRPG